MTPFSKPSLSDKTYYKFARQGKDAILENNYHKDCQLLELKVTLNYLLNSLAYCLIKNT